MTVCMAVETTGSSALTAAEVSMTRSEFIRMCIRKDAENQQNRKVTQIVQALAHPLAA